MGLGHLSDAAISVSQCPEIPFLVKDLQLSVHQMLIISTLLNQALMVLLDFKRSYSSHFSYSAGISLWFSEAINVSEHEN
jgi:hypothetical protein